MILNAFSLFLFQELSPHQGLSNLISYVKGPLEYISDLELPDEQLANIASDGETMRNDESDSSSCNSIVSSNICLVMILIKID